MTDHTRTVPPSNNASRAIAPMDDPVRLNNALLFACFMVNGDETKAKRLSRFLYENGDKLADALEIDVRETAAVVPFPLRASEDADNDD